MSKAKYIIKIIDDAKVLGDRANEIDVYSNIQHPTNVVNQLKDTIIANKDLVALSAPQIGIKERIFCIRFNDQIKAFINPMITKKEGFHWSRETSPSVGHKEYIVPRSDRILTMYQTPVGKPEHDRFEGRVSEVFEHMVNLLDGVLISDFGLEVLPEFDAATDEERAELLKKFAEQLKEEGLEMDKIIKSDDELKKMEEGIRFMTGVATGEVKLESNKDLNIEETKETKAEPKETKEDNK